MSEGMELLWDKAKDLKHDAHRLTNNRNIHGLLNDLIDEIELAMDEGDDGYDEEEDGIDIAISGD